MRSPWRSDRGSVTAETAVLLPALSLLFALLLVVARGVAAELATQDAARVAARAAARGESLAVVQSLARRVAPPGAHVEVSRAGSLLRVSVNSSFWTPPGLLGWLPALPLHASALAAPEPVG